MSNTVRRELNISTARDLETAPLAGLTWKDLCQICPGSGSRRPHAGPSMATDPRDDNATVFNPDRATRPADNNPDRADSSASNECAICRGDTTPIVDLAPLDGGFTFINPNLYPIFSPRGIAPGAHFVQWTSNRHNDDWPDLDSADRATCIGRLAALEHVLLGLADCPIDRERRHVSIIKNVGHRVGGSLSHGHQQVVLTGTPPRRVLENSRYFIREGSTFSRHVLKTTPPELVVRQLHTGTLLVPYYMRRPHDLLYVVANPAARHLHDLTLEEQVDMGSAMALGTGLMESVLTDLDKEVGYNVLFHTGSPGIYLEFLPRTQENGGFELLGLNACQATPAGASQRLRKLLSQVERV